MCIVLKISMIYMRMHINLEKCHVGSKQYNIFTRGSNPTHPLKALTILL